jgi:hypothetical protein
MHPCKEGIFIPNLQVRKNSYQLISSKSSLVKAVAGKTGAVVCYGLKIPPIMLRKITNSMPGVVFMKGLYRLPLKQPLNIDDCCDCSNFKLRQ